ncbi:signal peptidase II [uncultured Roseobacter sp.]|uniref:signal peptidase II n=1 Tax=uncultured Roseobacter sp. TaxID=114847 RepID=UPI0026061BDA|nr:signal peptidase II [uncultured Roseobacter sp.]
MRILALTALAAFVLDQLSKYLVIHTMELARIRAIDVLPPVLNFRYGENRGINFGLFSDGSEASRWILILLALAICTGVLIWVRRQQPGPWALAGAGLLIGGALANVLDRVLYGYVLDFLNMSCCGIDNPFVFNLADVFIFAGAIGLVFLAPDPGSTRKKGQ